MQTISSHSVLVSMLVSIASFLFDSATLCLFVFHQHTVVNISWPSGIYALYMSAAVYWLSLLCFFAYSSTSTKTLAQIMMGIFDECLHRNMVFKLDYLQLFMIFTWNLYRVTAGLLYWRLSLGHVVVYWYFDQFGWYRAGPSGIWFSLLFHSEYPCQASFVVDGLQQKFRCGALKTGLQFLYCTSFKFVAVSCGYPFRSLNKLVVSSQDTRTV